MSELIGQLPVSYADGLPIVSPASSSAAIFSNQALSAVLGFAGHQSLLIKPSIKVRAIQMAVSLVMLEGFTLSAATVGILSLDDGALRTLWQYGGWNAVFSISPAEIRASGRAYNTKNYVHGISHSRTRFWKIALFSAGPALGLTFLVSFLTVVIVDFGAELWPAHALRHLSFLKSSDADRIVSLVLVRIGIPRGLGS